MSYGRGMDVLRGAVAKHFDIGKHKKDVCKEARETLVKLEEGFDPWDGPVDYLLAHVYNQSASATKNGRRILEAIHDDEGDRVDKPAEQLTLFEAHQTYDRRVAQHEADGVIIARWELLLKAADKIAARRKADWTKTTLEDLLGADGISKYLGDSLEEAI